MGTVFLKVAEDTAGWSEKPGPIWRVLSLILPKANPDFEDLYREVSYWFLEVENEKIVREIGFSKHGEPIVIGPYGRNFGMWTDSPILLDPLEYGYEQIQAEDFEKYWLEVAATRAKSNVPDGI